jgi:hypothetical protein
LEHRNLNYKPMTIETIVDNYYYLYGYDIIRLIGGTL